MRTHSRLSAVVATAALAAVLGGCYTAPVYRPVAVQRLTPEQSAALNNGQQPTQADRDRIAAENLQAAQSAPTYTYGTPVTPLYAAPVAPVYYGPSFYDPYFYGGYPYAYPFYPAIGLSFGFGGRWGGGHGYHHGGFRGRR